MLLKREFMQSGCHSDQQRSVAGLNVQPAFALLPTEPGLSFEHSGRQRPRAVLVANGGVALVPQRVVCVGLDRRCT